MIGEECLKVGTRDNHDLSSGAVKVGSHSGLGDDFAIGEVDIPKHTAFVGRRDAKDDWDRTGGTPPTRQACGCQRIGRCIVGCIGGWNWRIVVEGWGNLLSPHGLRVHDADKLVDLNDVAVRQWWDVVDKVPWFSVENQLVERGQALVEEDGVVSQILEPETVVWSPGGNVLSC
jgi:hypothetical protein